MRAISAFVLTVVTLALFAMVKPYLEEHLSNVKQARQLYQDAVIRSYHDLTRIAYEILNETNLKLNLKWKLNHSNQGILRRYTRTGTLATIRVLTADCQLLASAAAGVTTRSPCLVSHQQLDNQPKFHWLQHNEQPFLMLSMPFSLKEETYYLITGVPFNQAWLNQHPPLKQLADQLDLTISPDTPSGGGLILIDEGFDAVHQHYVATLKTHHWLTSSLPGLLQFGSKQLNRIVSFLGIATLIMLGGVIYLLRSREQRLQNHLQGLKTWVSNLSPESATINSRESIDTDHYIHHIKEQIKHLHDFHFKRDRHHRESIHQLHAKIDELQQSYAKLQEQILQSQRHETFHIQFNQTAKGFQDRHRQLYDRLENIYDAMTHGLNTQAADLYRIMENWEQELKNVSPRKFVRSLAERPNSSQPNRSELDVALEQLSLISQQIVNLSVHLAIEVQKSLQDVHQSLQIVDHWGAINDGESEQTPYLLNVVIESQNMVPMTTNVPPHRFENRLDETLMIYQLNIPQNIWVSTIYHLNMALLETAKAWNMMDTILIQTRSRQRDGQSALILTCTTHHEPTGDVKPEKARVHLKLVQQLVRPYGLQLIELPNLHGMASLALTWQERDLISITGASTANHQDSTNPTPHS